MTDLSWEERWAQKRGDAFPDPDPCLLKQIDFLTDGTALDLACGRGRNSLLLAQAGYQVLAVDSSPTALELLTSTAEKRKLSITPILHDLTLGLPELPESVNLILSAYYLQRELVPAIKKNIRPGGLFIGRSFCQDSASNPSSAIIYNPGELQDLFSDWEILSQEEGVEKSRRGGTLSGIVARKPIHTN